MESLSKLKVSGEMGLLQGFTRCQTEEEQAPKGAAQSLDEGENGYDGSGNHHLPWKKVHWSHSSPPR